MPPSRTTVPEAYTILGLAQGASVEAVKSAYKQLALRTHPDKNPDNPEATVQFQQLGDAYATLLDYLQPNTGTHWDDEEDDEDDEYYAYERMDFYMFLFEELFRRDQSRAYPGSRKGYHRTHEAPGETPEQYQARLRRSREEQQAAEKRRKEEAAARKLRNEHEREQARLQAEQRRVDAIKVKKDQAENERKGAEATILKARKKAQHLRSAVFTAAREGKSDKVKKGIWEDDVDATGGEINPSSREFASSIPDDPTETLVHIAVRHGDLDLVQWLQSHNANSEEARNADGLTPFHVALRHGHIDIVKYFFDSHDPKDEDFENVYSPPEDYTLLSLAVISHEPEVVWMILEKGLASVNDINASWAWITSMEARSVIMKRADKVHRERFEDIRALIMRYGGFTPPPTPSVSELNFDELVQQSNSTSAKPFKSKHKRAQSHVPTEQAIVNPQTQPGRGKGRGRGRARGRG